MELFAILSWLALVHLTVGWLNEHRPERPEKQATGVGAGTKLERMRSEKKERKLRRQQRRPVSADWLRRSACSGATCPKLRSSSFFSLLQIRPSLSFRAELASQPASQLARRAEAARAALAGQMNLRHHECKSSSNWRPAGSALARARPLANLQVAPARRLGLAAAPVHRPDVCLPLGQPWAAHIRLLADPINLGDSEPSALALQVPSLGPES